MPSLFGFGKRRRVKRSSKKAKASRKPPARLLKICKKYHVKATKKVGGRRCYKSIACLKRCCLKKARAMKKKLMKMAKRKKMVKRSSKKVSRRRTNRRRTSMGADEEMMEFGKRRRKNCRRTSMGADEEMMDFGRRTRFGNEIVMDPEYMFGARRRIPMFGRRSRFGERADIYTSNAKCQPGLYGTRPLYNMEVTKSSRDCPQGLYLAPQFGKRRRTNCRRTSMFGEDEPDFMFGRRSRFGEDEPDFMFGRRSRFGEDEPDFMFGKRRGGAKVSKAKAMKAFRSFYKRHCKGRSSRFGNGGNPMLNASMGYEFCPNGMGGVLGANSTGLFPSPCMSSSSAGMRPAPKPAAPKPPAPRPAAPRPPARPPAPRPAAPRPPAPRPAAPRPPAPRPAAPRPPAPRAAPKFGLRGRRRSTATGDVRRRRRNAGGARRRCGNMYD